MLVQQAQPYNVDTVVIDGRILKHKGELVAIDADEVIRKQPKRLLKRASAPAYPIRSSSQMEKL